MTEKVYFLSDRLQLDTEVISCQQQEDGSYHVILASTIFHPQGGGQPSDTGVIGNVRMIHAIQSGNDVIHVTKSPLEPGIIQMRVDEDERHLHTRYHSARHLIAAAGEKYGWRGLKGNHRPGESRVIFDPLNNPQNVTDEIFAKDTAAFVDQNLPLRTEIAEGVRTVTWGKLPYMACGGTHVSSTGTVGRIRIVRVKHKKGQLSVQYELDD